MLAEEMGSPSKTIRDDVRAATQQKTRNGRGRDVLINVSFNTLEKQHIKHIFIILTDRTRVENS